MRFLAQSQFRRGCLGLGCLAVLALSAPRLYAQPLPIDLKITLLDVEGAASFDGTTIIAEVGTFVTIRFTVEHASGMAFLGGDEFNTRAEVPVPQSNIFRKQSMNSDSEDVPCSLAGCTGRIQTGETVTFSTTFLAESVGITTFSVGSFPSLRTDNNPGNNTLELAVEIVEDGGDSGVDLVLVVEDIQGALSSNPLILPLGQLVAISIRVTNNGPDDGTGVVISGRIDFFEIVDVTLDPDIGTCAFDPVDKRGVSGDLQIATQSQDLGDFICPDLTLAAGASVKVNVVGRAVVDDPEALMSAEAVHPNDPNPDNNIEVIPFGISDATVLIIVPSNTLTVSGGVVTFFIFRCPADGNGVPDFGDDGVPGTGDDDCEPVNVLWSVIGNIGTVDPPTGPTTTYTATLERGVTSESGQIVAEAGDQTIAAEVTVVRGGGIYGQKFFDADEDGMQDPNDLGLNGVLIILKDENGSEVARDTTRVKDENGDGFLDPFTEHGLFSFEDLAPGTYTASEDVPLFWAPTTPRTVSVTVEALRVDTVRFGNFTRIADQGDLPDPPYPTILFLGGAAHGLRDGLSLGPTVDAEGDGQPTLGADGDDLNGDDEDGLVRFEVLADGTAQVFVDVSLPPDVDRAELHAWIDFDDDGFLHPLEERILAETITSPGVYFATFPIPPGAVIRYARLRLTTAASGVSGTGAQVTVTPEGFWLDGEVEDYLLLVEDYGDAPDTADPARPDIPAGYSTRLGDNGARHLTVTGIRLGSANDGEADGFPSTQADGDDGNNLYDEDGLLFQDGFVALAVRPEPRTPGGLALRYGIGQGMSGTVLPLASVQGKLDAWVDFNRDGDWEDPGEQVFDSEDVQPGPELTPLTFTVPGDADPGYTFARFRFSQPGNLGFDGRAPNGEVEDYLLQILQPQAVATSADSGPGSLREALTNAIAAGVPVLIDLGSIGKKAATISLQSPLPAVTAPVVIRGAGTVLDGSAAGSGADGLVLAAGGSVVTGLTIQGFSGHGLVLGADGILVQDNTITTNDGDGIRVLGTANTLLGNALSGHGGLGIDRGGDGPTPNDDDESDGVQNTPVVTMTEVTDSTRIAGTLTSTPETAFAVEFFANEDCDGSGYGEGATPLGTTMVTTDASGQAGFAVALEMLLPRGPVVTATATGPDGSTSEFSQCIVATDIDAPEGDIPTVFLLHGNYPNPFNPATTIRFDLPEAARVHVEVYDVLGRLALALPPQPLDAGTGHTLQVDASSLSSGVYVYRIVAETPALTLTATGHFVLMK